VSADDFKLALTVAAAVAVVAAATGIIGYLINRSAGSIDPR
jgi:hypothetical protein